ncbi:Uncharacterised protein [Chlamydia trachomatis]|nr:Uncharacterised protein [Chlamydia trachomatis]
MICSTISFVASELNDSFIASFVTIPYFLTKLIKNSQYPPSEIGDALKCLNNLSSLSNSKPLFSTQFK